jgi:hypothetical protein
VQGWGGGWTCGGTHWRREPDRAADFGVASALISIAIVIALTFVGLASGTSGSSYRSPSVSGRAHANVYLPGRSAIHDPRLLPPLPEAGKEWAGGKPRRTRRHRRTRSGRVVVVPVDNQDDDDDEDGRVQLPDEETGLLQGRPRDVRGDVQGTHSATGTGAGVRS